MMTIRIQAKGVMLAAVAVCGLLLAGCQGHSPQAAADNYLSNLKLYNYPAIYQALSHQDQVDRTMDQFLTEIPMAPDVSKDWFKGILRTYDYKVGDAKIDGDKAIVTVSVTRPDLALWERTVDAGLSGDQTPDSIAQKNLTEGTYPKVTYDDDMVMVQQGGEWRLLVDFPFKENIIKEHKDAVDLYHQHDYDKAIAAYQKIIDELDKEQATGNAGLKFQYGRELADIQNAQKQLPDAQAYIPKIVLSDVDMKMSASRVPGIFGKMTNTRRQGDRRSSVHGHVLRGQREKQEGGFHRSAHAGRDAAGVHQLRAAGAAVRAGRDAQLWLSADGGAGNSAKGDAGLDGDVDGVHAIGGAAAEAGDADAVAGGVARGGGQRRGRARARGRGKPLTRRIAASAAAPRRAPDTPVRGAVRLS